MLFILTRVDLMPYFGGDILIVIFLCIYDYATLGQKNESLYQASGTDPSPYS